MKEDLRQYVGLAVEEAQEQLRMEELIENTAVVVAVRTIVIDAALFVPVLCHFPDPDPFPGPYLSPSLSRSLSPELAAPPPS